MSALTDAAAERVLAFITNQQAQSIEPVLPLRVALFTTIGSDTVQGTEVTGGGYGRQVFNPTAPTTLSGITTVSNSTLIRFNNMPEIPSPGVQAFALFDSASTPFRWVWAPLRVARVFEAGDPAEFAVGELVITCD